MARLRVFRIIEGISRSVTDQNRPMMEHRTELACKNCALSHNDKGQYTGVCKVRNGGCGCRLDSKTRVHDEMCPVGVWQWDVIDLNRLAEVNAEYDFKK